jgi:hypothetical protein
MPRPENLSAAMRKVGDPSFEDELRGTANWLRSRTLKRKDLTPSVKTHVIEVDAEFACWIASTMDAHADLRESVA